MVEPNIVNTGNVRYFFICDVVQVDFHTDAAYSNRIPTRAYTVDDSNREYYNSSWKGEAKKRRRKQVEEMRLAKKLQMLQDVYLRKGIVI